VTHEKAGLQRPQGRYGERRTSRVVVVASVALAVALLGWLLWVAVAASDPDTRSTVVSFRVVDDREVSVRFEVIADRDETVTCTVQAQDARGATVGLATVEVPPGPRDRRDEEVVVETRGRAATATVADCRLGAAD
jgi:hypothetical protein